MCPALRADGELPCLPAVRPRLGLRLASALVRFALSGTGRVLCQVKAFEDTRTQQNDEKAERPDEHKGDHKV